MGPLRRRQERNAGAFDHIATLVAAQREHDAGLRNGTTWGLHPRHAPDTQVAHTLGCLPGHGSELSLVLLRDRQPLPPRGPPAAVVIGRRCGVRDLYPSFELKADLSPEAAKVIVDRQIWRPGERREWDPGTPLPEVP